MTLIFGVVACCTNQFENNCNSPFLQQLLQCFSKFGWEVETHTINVAVFPLTFNSYYVKMRLRVRRNINYVRQKLNSIQLRVAKSIKLRPESSDNSPL